MKIDDNGAIVRKNTEYLLFVLQRILKKIQIISRLSKTTANEKLYQWHSNINISVFQRLPRT